MVVGDSFAKTICSICYEDLKPIVEDLQSISICGHVFHELCLQQWFEYCTNGKKKNCPVCKQTCNEKSVGRLYFQSIGDPNDQGFSQKVQLSSEGNPEELRKEVKRLEVKVSGLSSTLDQQQKDFQQVNAELIVYREQCKSQSTQTNEAVKQKEAVEQLLKMKSEELNRSTLECMRLQERNIALAKELASLKLACDLNINEEDVLKLASLGNEANTKEIIDVLKRTLIIRNRSYKELMTKCNLLGRGEARSLSMLEKAKAKITRFKERIQELEKAIEAKDNQILRNLTGSRRTISQVNYLYQSDTNSNRCNNKVCEEPPTTVKPSKTITFKADCWDRFGNRIKPNGSCIDQEKMTKEEENPASALPSSISLRRNGEGCPKDIGKMTRAEDFGVVNIHQEKNTSSPYIIIEDDDMKSSAHNVIDRPLKNLTDHERVVQSSPSTRVEALVNTTYDLQSDKSEINHSSSGSKNLNKADIARTSAAVEDSMVMHRDDQALVSPLLLIRKETSPRGLTSEAGSSCFSGGLIGPDGTKRHLGKWCKKAQNKDSVPPSVQSEGLIATGADGRGGRIKVLRSRNDFSLDGKDNAVTVKRCKFGVKSSGLQSQGSLQIEHFFGKASQ